MWKRKRFKQTFAKKERENKERSVCCWCWKKRLNSLLKLLDLSLFLWLPRSVELWLADWVTDWLTQWVESKEKKGVWEIWVGDIFSLSLFFFFFLWQQQQQQQNISTFAAAAVCIVWVQLSVHGGKNSMQMWSLIQSTHFFPRARSLSLLSLELERA